MEMAIPLRVTAMAMAAFHESSSPSMTQPARAAIGGARVMKS